MYFLLRCDCGKETSVSEGAAGVSVACTCGRQIVVPPLVELRRRAGMGEFACSLSADGTEPPPQNPATDMIHRLFCWLILVVGGLVALLGVAIGLRRIALLIGIALMAAAATAMANQAYRRKARAREREELRRLTLAHQRARAQLDDPAEPGDLADGPAIAVPQRSTSIKAGPPLS
jgi:hypothetical protein